MTTGGRSSWGAAVVSLLVVSCASGADVAGYPLYPVPGGQRLPRGEIARLYGPFASVDGRDVSSLGDALEVLPGCHEVRTRNTPFQSGAYVTTTGKVGAAYFVLPAKAGHSYVFKREVQTGMGSRMPVSVFVEELDASGGSAQMLHPVAWNTHCS